MFTITHLKYRTCRRLQTSGEHVTHQTLNYAKFKSELNKDATS